MASRRDLIEAEDFQRRRGVAALQRGDTLAVEDVPRRPNAALVAGLLIAVLIAAGSAGTAFLTGRPPDGWLNDGSLVVDKETGGRYVATGGTLRPTPTLTAALLAGARNSPVLVPHARVLATPVGLPVPGAGTPEVPPTMPTAAISYTACLTGQDAVDVFGGRVVGDQLNATGLLVHPENTNSIVLLDRQRAFLLPPAGQSALGYSANQVRDVPVPWLALVPPGPVLAPITPPRGAELVTAAGSGREFVIDAGRARPVANPTSTQLLPPSSRTVPDGEIAALPAGPPFGILDAPSVPPRVPAPEVPVVPCVFGGGTNGASVGYAGAVSDSPDTRPAPPRLVRSSTSVPLLVTWHFGPGQGALLGPSSLNQARPSDQADLRDAGIVLVDGGVAYPVTDTRTLQMLGYRREQVVIIDRPWLALLALGTTLRPPS